ncbi:MAG: TorF family putative porin [Gammaproteobacteria bacterium]|nr:TorF family putative porin [Gammaproteobacteria bacterium]
MKKIISLFALGAILVSPAALAQRGSGHVNDINGYVSGDFRLSTNYLFRGLTLSNNKTAVSHSLSYTFEVGAYIGYWASNVELVNSANLFESGIEVDIFAGYKASFDEENKYGLDFGIQHYFYDLDEEINHNEIFINVIVTDFTFSYFSGVGPSSPSYFEISWSSELGGDGLTTLSMSLGYSNFFGRAKTEEEFTALTYLLGLSFYFGSTGDLTIGYSGVTRDTEEYGLASVARNSRSARNRAFVSWGISF